MTTTVPPSPISSQQPLKESALRPLTINRSTTLRGKKELEWFFGVKHNLYLPKGDKPPCVRAAWAVRELKEGASPTLFLISVSKKNVRKAHDRNKVKRWMRAALQQVATLPEIAKTKENEGQQLILMIAGLRGPGKDCTFGSITSEVEQYITSLEKKLKRYEIPS